MPTLAASGDVTSVLVILLILLPVVIAALYAVMRFRRWLRSDDTPTTPGFTLSDLRQLHRDGNLTDEEFERAREQILAGAKAMAAKMPHPLARPGDDPPLKPGPDNT